MIFTSSCKNAPKIDPIDSCTYDHQFKICICVCYDLMKPGRIDDSKCGEFKSGEYPVARCDGYVGFHFKKVLEEIIPWGKKTRRFYEDTCK